MVWAKFTQSGKPFDWVFLPSVTLTVLLGQESVQLLHKKTLKPFKAFLWDQSWLHVGWGGQESGAQVGIHVLLRVMCSFHANEEEVWHLSWSISQGNLTFTGRRIDPEAFPVVHICTFIVYTFEVDYRPPPLLLKGGGAASFRKYLTNMFFYFTKISTVYLTCLGFRCLKRLTSGNFPEPLGPDFSFSPKNNPNSHPSKQKQVVWIRFWGRQTVCTGCKTWA